jgi:membrane dipeptidase
MDRRTLLRKGVILGAGALAAPMLNFGRCRLDAAELQVSTRAVDLVLGSTVIDMLGLLTLNWPKLYGWWNRPAGFGEDEFRRLKGSGVNVLHPAVDTGVADAYEGARRWLAGWNALLPSRPCFLARAGSTSDLFAAERLGKIGVIVGFQDSDHFRTPAEVGLFHGLGQRVSQLTYNGRNRIGSGCLERHDHGLSKFGVKIVEAMDRVGMAVDVSHCGEHTTIEAIAASRNPVLVTHSNCKALSPHPRCKSDAVIRRMAARGGVMGITAVRALVGGAAPTLDDLLDHFDHVARLVGVEHVGLGSDVDLDGVDPATGRPYPYYQIRGLDLPERVFQITEGLLRRGYADRDVGLILGGNFLRALSAIWPASPAVPFGERDSRRDPFCPLAPPVTAESLARGLAG